VSLSRRFSVAPMMDRTDRHCRVLMRLISRRALLYTEMITSPALVRGRTPERFLGFCETEHPLALQLGGSDPQELTVAARMAEDRGYDEINLNVGCPSDRVTSGRFGACLMAEPKLVAECVAAMRGAVAIPVTVKTRIGVDNLDSPEYLAFFVETVAQAGCTTFIIHARKAWLKGLSPKENREIPPLHYERVHALKAQFPHLEFILNGGVTCLRTGAAHMSTAHGPALDGVMVGRAAYDTPYILADVDRLFFGDQRPVPPRAEIAGAYIEYARTQAAAGVLTRHVLRHAAGLFHACPGAKGWRNAVMTAGREGVDLAGLAALANDLDGQRAEAA
jgi:tRNA-dihydrouridine synthase A